MTEVANPLASEESCKRPLSDEDELSLLRESDLMQGSLSSVERAPDSIPYLSQEYDQRPVVSHKPHTEELGPLAREHRRVFGDEEPVKKIKLTQKPLPSILFATDTIRKDPLAFYLSWLSVQGACLPQLDVKRPVVVFRSNKKLVVKKPKKKKSAKEKTKEEDPGEEETKEEDPGEEETDELFTGGLLSHLMFDDESIPVRRVYSLNVDGERINSRTNSGIFQEIVAEVMFKLSRMTVNNDSATDAFEWELTSALFHRIYTNTLAYWVGRSITFSWFWTLLHPTHRCSDSLCHTEYHYRVTQPRSKQIVNDQYHALERDLDGCRLPDHLEEEDLQFLRACTGDPSLAKCKTKEELVISLYNSELVPINVCIRYISLLSDRLGVLLVKRLGALRFMRYALEHAHTLPKTHFQAYGLFLYLFGLDGGHFVRRGNMYSFYNFPVRRVTIRLT